MVPVPEDVSIIASSADVGGPTRPPVPPEVAAQLVLEAVFHVPAPPTQ